MIEKVIDKINNIIEDDRMSSDQKKRILSSLKQSLDDLDEHFDYKKIKPEYFEKIQDIKKRINNM